MKISAIGGYGAAFGRRPKKHEEEEIKQLEKQAAQVLGSDTTGVIFFDTSIPKQKYDPGIGTSFSKDAQKQASFLKKTFAANMLLLEPQGEISDAVHSPYSSSNFSLGRHLIDLDKLTSRQYGRILSRNDLNNAPYLNKKRVSADAEYSDILGREGHDALLKKAYDRFKKLKHNDLLVKEYENFQKRSEYWLERDSLFGAAAVLYGTNNITKWPERAQNVYADKDGDKEMIKHLKSVTDAEGRNVSDYEKFVQFIADKQQRESVKNFNLKGIQVFGDCPISCSQKDFWSHRSAFSPHLRFGQYNDKTGEYNCWEHAFDFDKLDGDAGEMLYNKFDLFFKRYNGIRVDAAWQLINPLLLTPKKDEYGRYDYDEENNLRGIKDEKEQRSAGDKIITGILMRAAEDNNIPPKNILLEMLGGNSYASLPHVKNRGMLLTHITKYGEPGWGRVKYYEGASSNPYDYQNMKPGEYIIGPGTHDNESVLEQYRLDNEHTNGRVKRSSLLAADLGLNASELEESREKWKDAVFAELYTTSSRLISLPDILGEDRRINEPGVPDKSWNYRSVPDYQNQYYRNIQEGTGLNLPDALSIALRAEGKAPELADRLAYYADVLREPEEKGGGINLNA